MQTLSTAKKSKSGMSYITDNVTNKENNIDLSVVGASVLDMPLPFEQTVGKWPNGILEKKSKRRLEHGRTNSMA